MILHDTISRLRAPLVSSSYGNQSRNWAAATSTTFVVHWSARSVAEVVGDEAQTVTRGKIFGGPDLDLEASDRVLFDGDTYEVDGEIMRSYKQGQLHHVRAFLRRVAVGGASTAATSDPRGSLFARADLLKGAQIGAWDTNGGLLTTNSGARALTQQAGVQLIRWQPWLTPCDLRGTLCQLTSDWLTGLATARSLAAGGAAVLLIGLPPIWSGHYPGQPDPWSYAWQQWVVQKTVQALGPAAADHLLFEMGNEPDNYAGLSGQQYYDTLWAPNVAALKAWARSTLGQEIFVGGPAWANSYTANLTDIGAWLTACKNAYVASGNRDHLPDFVSTHTYLSTPSENDTNAHAAARISTWGDFYRSLRVLINSTFSGLTDRGFPVADQLKVIDSEYNSTIDNASTVNNSSLFTDAYMINMFDMFRTSGVWAAVEFTIASHGGGALDLLTSGGAAKPLWTSLWAR
jgi:hypothetical protein